MSINTPMPPKPERKKKEYPVLSFREIMETIENSCGDVFITERYGKGDNKVIILPEAKKELDVMIAYGRRAPINVYEQKYSGYGHIIMDEKGNVIIIVKHFIEIHTMNRSKVSASNLGPNGEYNHGLDFLEYYREEFLKNEAKYNTDANGNTIDPFMEICGASEFVLEGHTHPDLGVFFSTTDRTSGEARAASSPICIFVCDPIRKEMLGAIGKVFDKAEILVYALKAESTQTSSAIMPISTDAEGVANLANQCISLPGYSGSVRYYTRFDRKKCLRLKIIVPAERKEG